MNHWVKKAGIMNNEWQMIPLPPPNPSAVEPESGKRPK